MPQVGWNVSWGSMGGVERRFGVQASKASFKPGLAAICTVDWILRPAPISLNLEVVANNMLVVSR